MHLIKADAYEGVIKVFTNLNYVDFPTDSYLVNLGQISELVFERNLYENIGFIGLRTYTKKSHLTHEIAEQAKKVLIMNLETISQFDLEKDSFIKEVKSKLNDIDFRDKEFIHELSFNIPVNKEKTSFHKNLFREISIEGKNYMVFSEEVYEKIQKGIPIQSILEEYEYQDIAEKTKEYTQEFQLNENLKTISILLKSKEDISIAINSLDRELDLFIENEKKKASHYEEVLKKLIEGNIEIIYK